MDCTCKQNVPSSEPVRACPSPTQYSPLKRSGHRLFNTYYTIYVCHRQNIPRGVSSTVPMTFTMLSHQLVAPDRLLQTRNRFPESVTPARAVGLGRMTRDSSRGTLRTVRAEFRFLHPNRQSGAFVCSVANIPLHPLLPPGQRDQKRLARRACRPRSLVAIMFADETSRLSERPADAIQPHRPKHAIVSEPQEAAPQNVVVSPADDRITHSITP